MSAIAGVWYLDGRPVGHGDLEAMADRLAHRGPDGAGTWSAGSIGMVHRRLWTTPESLHEGLPLVHRGDDLVLTADMRIDNRAELIATLGLTQKPDRELSDAELLLAAYERWGDGCPGRVIGDFAFALWDARRQRLLCARDAIGVKGFYYYHRPGHVFAFASEIKALLCLADVPRRLNEVRLGDYLVAQFEDTAGTFYRDVLRLPAAHSLALDREGVRIHRYWSLDPSRELRLDSDQEYADAFRQVFTEAVRCRLRSTSPVGSTLSGGLDSSSIACTARHLLAAEGTQRVHTFSATFPNLPAPDLRRIDEREYVEAVLALEGFERHCVEADRVSPLVDVAKVTWHLDEPLFAPNLYIHWELYRAASQSGVRVFLDGLDGDSTVSHGLTYLAELARTFRWKAMIAEAAALSRRSPNAHYTPRRIVREYALRPLLPAGLLQGWRWLHRRPQEVTAADTILRTSFSHRSGLAERTRALRRAASGPIRSAREDHWRGLTSSLHQTTLEISDKAAGAFSLEGRYPFYDRRLMEYCLALPPEQKLRDGWGRIVLRRAMAGVLPPAVQWRPDKANLSPSFLRGLLEHERDTLERVVFEEPQLTEAYVDLSALRGVYQRYAAEPLQRTDEALTLFRVANLALWLRQTGLRP